MKGGIGREEWKRRGEGGEEGKEDEEGEKEGLLPLELRSGYAPDFSCTHDLIGYFSATFLLSIL